MTPSSSADRHSIKDPIPEIFEAWALLSEAVDVHLAGKSDQADQLFQRADIPAVWNWTNPAWGPSPSQIRLNVRVWEPHGDTHTVPATERDQPPTRSVKAAVLGRDGHRCRYCGIPVVDAGIREIAHALYQDAVPWNDHNEHEQHAAFQCFWLQYDHVVPRSHGGRSSEDNLVVSCALCNFGKDKYTLRQLDISDPRLRPPEPVTWDGLERPRELRTLVIPRRAVRRPMTKQAERVAAATAIGAEPDAFFLPGAWGLGSGQLCLHPVDCGQRALVQDRA